jgi:glycerol-3-phosphate acyltransferase PlsX
VTIGVTGRPVTLLDMGANIAPKPQHLLQYALMGQTFQRDCLKVTKPRIGLLNIGEEASKGTELLKGAHELLTRSGLTFVGNLEGSDVFQDRAEVIVADGFTGNVVLKLLEGFAGFMLNLVLGELQKHGVKWAPEALANVRRTIDYSEYGGALLLGVSGIVVIGHGRSDANAVKNALLLAAQAVDKRVNAHIVQGLSRATGERQAAGGG